MFFDGDSVETNNHMRPFLRCMNCKERLAYHIAHTNTGISVTNTECSSNCNFKPVFLNKPQQQAAKTNPRFTFALGGYAPLVLHWNVC